MDHRDGVDGMCSTKSRNQDLGGSEVFDLPGSRKDEYPDLGIEEDMTAHLSSLVISPMVCSIGTAGSALRR